MIPAYIHVLVVCIIIRTYRMQANMICMQADISAAVCVVNIYGGWSLQNDAIAVL
jgi:hypothetical protein